MTADITLDLSRLIPNIRSTIRDRERAARKALEEIADWWAGEAKDLAPFREGFLTADITQTCGLDGKSMYAAVYIPSNAPSASYALEMHEGFYRLGKKSEAKAAKLGTDVGRRFISRPLEGGQSEILEIFKDNLSI